MVLCDKFNRTAARMLGEHPTPANPRERLDMVSARQRLEPRDVRILLFLARAASQMRERRG